MSASDKHEWLCGNIRITIRVLSFIKNVSKQSVAITRSLNTLRFPWGCAKNIVSPN